MTECDNKAAEIFQSLKKLRYTFEIYIMFLSKREKRELLAFMADNDKKYNFLQTIFIGLEWRFIQWSV